MTTREDQQIDDLINRHEASWRQGYGAFPDVLKRMELKRGVEVGVAFGGHSEAILQNAGVTELFGVDSYQHRPDYDDPMNLPQPTFDRLAQRVVQRLATFDRRFELVHQASAIASKRFEDESLDFVYLDADHSEQGVLDDLCAWSSKVRVGGVIAGHDYGHPDFPGVKHAIDRYFGRFGWRVHEAGHHVWWVQRHRLPVTFFTPSYNCEDSIRASAQSILDDHLKPGDEYILVNDGSSDSTGAILDALAQSHRGVRSIHHPTNRGGAAARNTAVQSARHPLCFCLDADNLLLPGTIDALRHRMLTCDADVVALQETRFFTDNADQSEPTHTHFLEDRVYGLADYLSTHRVPGSGGNHLFTKASWRAVGGYPQDAHALDTWGFGLRIAANGFKTSIAPKTAYLHRCSSDSYWNRHLTTGSVNDDAYRLLEPYLEHIHPADARYLATKTGRARWFTDLNSRPIRTRASMPTSSVDSPVDRIKQSLRWMKRKITPSAKAA